MHRLLFFLLMTALSTGALMAQDAGKTSRAKELAQDYAKVLNLTAEQRQMATKIFGEHLSKSRENWHAADGEKEAFDEAQQATFKATDTKIKALLNDEQLAIYKEKRQELKRKSLEYYVSEHVKE